MAAASQEFLDAVKSQDKGLPTEQKMTVSILRSATGHRHTQMHPIIFIKKKNQHLQRQGKKKRHAQMQLHLPVHANDWFSISRYNITNVHLQLCNEMTCRHAVNALPAFYYGENV